MLMTRPLIRANDNRVHTAFMVVFFIFLFSNVGGSLTPLGDPPLFLGFLNGVDYFWAVQHIFPATLFMVFSLLVIFYIIDSYCFKKEVVLPADPTPVTRRIGFDGGANFWLLGAAAGLVLMSGVWKSSVAIDIAGTVVGLPGMVRDLGLIIVNLISLRITAKSVHDRNQFLGAPMQEVAKLLVGIFLTIIPVIAMLKAGVNGPFSAVVAGITRSDGTPDPVMYFWATGLLSSFLDNAPTHLVFSNTAGGDPKVLMTTLAPTLAAISAGAVFMGANSYIGNAPNSMVKAVAEDRGLKMSSFFGYLAWSCSILIPLLIIMTFIWFK
jgi:Na+/H+ antiporter NhaD/arsenite permease-like protein